MRPRRSLTTILFTDIAGSTEHAARLGDREWSRVLAEHHARVRRELKRFRGREANTAGDGFLATFDRPATALRCAWAIRSTVRELGLEIRSGVHAGEMEGTGRELGGLGVHLGARIAAAAAPGEILASSTVRELVTGAGFRFEDRGRHSLRGIPEDWRLWALTKPPAGSDRAAGGRVRDLAHRRTLVAAGVALTALLGLSTWWIVGRASDGGASPADAEPTTGSPLAASPRIAVLPFETLGAAGDDAYFADGVTYDIVTRLSQVPELAVLSHSSVGTYLKRESELPAIDEALGATHVVEGSVQRAGSRVRVTARLLDTRTGELLWGESYDHELADIFAVQSDVATRVAGALQTRLSAEVRRRVERRHTDDPTAYALYLRGRSVWSGRGRENLEEAGDYFERAIVRDSTFAAAWAGLADTRWLQAYAGYRPEDEALRESERAARRALELDPSLAAAHASLSLVAASEHDWPGFVRSIRRAIELEPSYASAHHWYSHYLVGTGEVEKAVAEIRLAQDLDPLSPVIAENVGHKLFHARRYADAIEAYERALVLDPGNPDVHAGLAMTYAELGRLDEARRHLEKAIEIDARRVGTGSAGLRARLAAVEAQAGRPDRARSLLREAEAGGANPFEIALAYLALGDVDHAFEWLGRTEWTPSRAVRVHPDLDPVRDDPRFAQLSTEIDRWFGLRS